MSGGIEVAGLVLGALPLVVEVLKTYTNGISTMGRYLRYKIPLKRLATELDTEYVVYQNTCERLLDGPVDDNEEREALLREPGGPAWKNPRLERELEQRLLRGYEAFVNTMNEIDFAVSEIMKLLKFGPDRHPQFNAANGFEKEYQRLKFSLKKSKYDSLVAIIRTSSAALRELTNQSLVLEPSRSARRTPNFDLIRRHAASVHTALCTGLKCNCQIPHVIYLRLEHIKDCQTSSDLPPFRVILLYSPNLVVLREPPWKIGVFDIRSGQQQVDHEKQNSLPVRNKPKRVNFRAADTMASVQPALTPKPVHIKQICEAIHQLKGKYMGSYIGFMEQTTEQRLDFYQSEEKALARNPAVPPFLSLHEAFTRQVTQRRRFSTKNGLLSAVRLSSTLLQLYQTPWLTEMWSHKDIAFFEQVNGGLSAEPFIWKTPPHEKDESLTDSGFSPWDGPVRNQFLFALGIFLIELCLDAPFEQLRSRCGDTQSSLVQASDMKIANQLLPEVSEEFGPYYATAVRRCIRCDFDTDKMDLEDMAFSKAVYQGVVIPLEDAFKSFSGGSAS